MFQRQSQPDDTTRRLSASFHYDQSRAQQLLDLVLGERHRFLVRYEDIDTTVVTRYAASAARMWRQYLIAAASAFAVIVAISLAIGYDSRFDSAPSYVASAIVNLLLLGIVLWFVKVLIGTASRLNRNWVDIRGNAPLVIGWIVGLLLVLTAPFDLGTIRSGAILGVAGVFGIYLHQAYASHRLLVNSFQADNWSRDAAPAIDREFADGVDEIAMTTTDVNSTIYSGFTPFVGAGREQYSETLALQVEPAADVDAVNGQPRVRRADLRPRPPQDQVLNDLIEGMASLDVLDLEARRWHVAHGLHAATVSSTDIGPMGRPTGSVNGRAIAEGAISDEFARTYLWLSSSLWGGELVLNSFVRIASGPEDLFLELSHHALLPIDKWSARCEDAVPLDGLDLFFQATRDALRNTLLLPSSAGWFALHRYRWRRTRRRVQRLADKQIAIDRGAEVSIRELFTTNAYDHYFQLMDNRRYRLTINESLLHKIDGSLRRHGWAIANLDQVMNVLNNYGTIDGNINQGRGNVMEGARKPQGTSS